MEETGRILALDVGRRRIGLAISDALGWTAQGLPTLERENFKQDLRRLRELVVEREVQELVVGEPRHLSGQESSQAEYIRTFAEALREGTGLPLHYLDERWTSRQAERALREGGVRMKGNRGAIDQMSAVIILDTFLEMRRQASPAESE